jgi:hypothetical protein
MQMSVKKADEVSRVEQGGAWVDEERRARELAVAVVQREGQVVHVACRLLLDEFGAGTHTTQNKRGRQLRYVMLCKLLFGTRLTRRCTPLKGTCA